MDNEVEDARINRVLSLAGISISADYDEVRGLPGTGQSASFQNEVFWLDGETKAAMRQRHPKVGLPYRQPLIRNLGKLAGMLIAHAVMEAEMHGDVDAFHAPSECHGDVARGCLRDAIALVESIEQATGYSLDEIEDELQARCSGKWLWNSGVWMAFQDVKEHRERQAMAKQNLRWRQKSKLV